MEGEVGGNAKKRVMICDIMSLVKCRLLGKYEHYGKKEDTSYGVNWG